MHIFKIENYEREHGLGTFVPFCHLTPAKADSIKEALRNRLKLPKDALPKDILQTIQNRSIPVEGVNAEADEFDLCHLLDRLGLSQSEFTYLNWYHFDDVDEIRTRDLFTTFSDVWYPAVDDLELIDSRIQWVLSIHHCGTVKALSFG